MMAETHRVNTGWYATIAVCPICTKLSAAIFEEDVQWLECPNCSKMVATDEAVRFYMPHKDIVQCAGCGQQEQSTDSSGFVSIHLVSCGEEEEA